MATSGAAAGAFAHAHHVAFGVRLDAGQAGLPQQIQKRPGALGFLEWRRRDLGELDRFRDESIVGPIEKRRRLSESWRLEHANDARVRRGLTRSGRQARGDQHDGQQPVSAQGCRIAHERSEPLF